FLNDLVMDDKYLVLSGRIAGEILMKAARSGVSLILSRSAPTLRTVELAEILGLTIVGFARGERFNVYTHWNRIEI
ncbi:MAG: formate dehydrogenase accessory sulfurtransferase FdhD, partial [Deltaproteobacteria bacterium]